MGQMLKIISKLLVLFIVSACSNVNVTTWSFPYSPTVQQGNYITDKMLAAIHVGMTKQQVIAAMDGAEPLSQFAFDNNIWVYIYQVYKNEDLVENRQVTLEFKDNKVVKIVKKNSV
jgi:outer membrane protein assembly factor BamE (lipoprotein component of BamABCDE complex)